MSKIKTLALHLGSHKTGTTTVQEWMSQMSRSGATLPFNYADAGRKNEIAHHDLALSFKFKGDCQALHDVRRETLDSSFQKTLISSETFSLLDPQSVGDLISVLSCTDYQITTYVTLRNVDSFSESIVSQWCKRSLTPPLISVQAALERRKSFVTNMLTWIDEIGAENFHLLTFEQAKIAEQGLWQVWWNFIGHPEIAQAHHEDQSRISNTSFSLMTLAVVLALGKRLDDRRIPYSKNDQFVNEITIPVEQRLRQLTGKQYTNKISLFTPAQRRELLDAARKTEQALVDALGLNQPFFEDVDDLSFPQSNLSFLLEPDSKDHPEEMVSLFHHLLEFAEARANERLEVAGSSIGDRWNNGTTPPHKADPKHIQKSSSR